jgi:dTDP-glucose 4,6-dehydratase
MDTSRIRNQLGWHPRHDLESGLRQTVQWYIDHPQWIESITAREGYETWMRRNYAQRGAG